MLVAEDNPINQKIAQKTLEKLGCRVRIVANGHEVLNAIKDLEFDLILMDCQMPEMDGYQTTEALRQRQAPDVARIPIIAMTANEIEGDRERCLKIGMDDYVLKPVGLDVLSKVLEKWVPHAAGSSSVLEPEASKTMPPELWAELVDIYVTDNSARVETIAACAKSGDYSKMVREAHALKSSSAAVGAMSVSSAARAIEVCDFTRVDGGMIDEMVRLLKRHFEESCSALTRARI